MRFKKAQMQTFIVYTLVILLLFVILAFFLIDVEEILEGMSRKDRCKADVYKKAALKKIEFSEKEKHFDCEREDIKLKNDDETESKQRIAEAMYDCWDQFHEGKYALLDEEKIYCTMCAYITFEEKNPINRMTRYLLYTNIPGSNLKYYDYLQGYETEDSEIIEGVEKDSKKVQELDNEVIDTTEDYGVIFMYAGGTDRIKELLKYLDPTTEESQVFAVTGTAFVGGVAVAMTLSGPIGWTIAGLAAGATLAYDRWFAEGAEPEHVSFVVVREYKPAELEKLGCEALVGQKKIIS